MIAKPEESTHFHHWYMEPHDLSCERCACGAILVSQYELDRRQEDWNQYWRACHTTKAAAVLEEMRQALKPEYKKDVMVEVKKVRAKIATLTHKDKNDYGDAVLIPNETEVEQFRPHFPEPERFRDYIVKDNS